MATIIEKSFHYGGEVEVNFYPSSHRYKLANEKDYLIGVTTATGKLDKSRPLMIWAGRVITNHLRAVLESGGPVTAEDIDAAQKMPDEAKDEAGASGKLVHEWAERWIKGENPEVPEDPKVRNGAIAFLTWVKENDVRFVSSEKRVYSKKYGYVGTMDTSFTMGANGENHKIIHAGDFKTGSGIYLDMAFQVSAYQHAEAEEHGTVYGDKCIVRFDKETGEFKQKWFPLSEHKMHLRGFLACLELKKLEKIWDKTHNDFYKKEKTS